MTGQTEYIEHPFSPVYDENSRVLVLGTMASPASRKMGFYYGHPQNRFWKVLGALWNEDIPFDVEARRSFALEHGIALSDVLSACSIDGASDASIKDPVPSNLSEIVEKADIQAVVTTGAKAASLYRKLHPDLYPKVPHIALPSTSGANARMGLSDLIEAYKVVKDYADA